MKEHEVHDESHINPDDTCPDRCVGRRMGGDWCKKCMEREAELIAESD